VSDGSPLAVRPHRGTLILVLGILGIVPCFVLGIVAWVMANADLKAMAAGEMDRAGEGMTKAGKICGIVGCIAPAVHVLIFTVLGAWYVSAHK
jgi:hypothetical protein